MGWGNNDGDTFFWGYRTKYKGYFSFSVYGIWNGSWNVVNTGVRVDSARHVFDLGPGAQKLDGVTYATGYPGEVMQNNLKNGAVPHIMLFGTSVGWTSDINYFAPSVEIYAVKIYQQGELVADLCPAICPAKLDDPDGVGFYDLKRKEFFTGRMSSITGSKTRLRNGGVVSTEVLPAPPGLAVIIRGIKTSGKGD